MNVFINPKLLSMQLRSIEQYLNTKNASEFVVLEATNGTLTIKGSSYSVQFATAPLACTVIGEGYVGVQFSILAKLVAGFRSLDAIMISYNASSELNSKLKISANSSSYTVPARPGSEVPVTIEIDDDNSKYDLEMDVDELYRAIHALESFTPNDIGRPMMHGNCIEVSDNCLRVIATDGHRMAVSEINVPAVTQLNKEPDTFILPIYGILKLLRSLLPLNMGNKVRVQLGDRFAQFMFPSGLILKGTLIESNYIMWRRVMSQESGYEVSFNRSQLQVALQRLSCLMANKKFQGVKFEFTKDKLFLNAVIQQASNDIEQGSEVLEVDNPQGLEITIGFNASYLNDCINIDKSNENVTLTLFNPDAPVKVDYGHTVAVTMPLRV